MAMGEWERVVTVPRKLNLVPCELTLNFEPHESNDSGVDAESADGGPQLERAGGLLLLIAISEVK